MSFQVVRAPHVCPHVAARRGAGRQQAPTAIQRRENEDRAGRQNHVVGRLRRVEAGRPGWKKSPVGFAGSGIPGRAVFQFKFRDSGGGLVLGWRGGRGGINHVGHPTIVP
jgi:hypothetical protein